MAGDPATQLVISLDDYRGLGQPPALPTPPPGAPQLSPADAQFYMRDDMADIPREEAQVRDDLIEARTDTKFAQLIGKIDVTTAELKGEFGKIAERLDGVEKSTGGVKATIIGTAVAVLILMVTILGYGQQWFGIGMSTRDIVKATVTEINAQHK